jgi:hypothetical protein
MFEATHLDAASMIRLEATSLKKKRPSQPLRPAVNRQLHPRESQAVPVANAVELPRVNISNSGLDKRER